MCFYCIEIVFGIIVVVRNEAVANQMGSRWYCMVVRNLMVRFYVHNSKKKKKKKKTEQQIKSCHYYVSSLRF